MILLTPTLLTVLVSCESPTDTTTSKAFITETTVVETATVSTTTAETEDTSTKKHDIADPIKTFPTPFVPCPTVGKTAQVGVLTAHDLDEASGLVVSPAQPDLLWAHNDSGSGPSLFALNASGEHLGRWDLSFVGWSDWEDMSAIVPPGTTTAKLYIGSIGDNDTSRDDISVIIIEEPIVDPKKGPVEELISKGLILTMTYPDGAHDAETLLVDPLTEDIFVVTKNWKGETGIYKKPAPHLDGEIGMLSLEVTLNFCKKPFNGCATTAGDVSINGEWIVIRTYFSEVYMWYRDPMKPLETAFSKDPCPLNIKLLGQMESIGLDSDLSGFYSIPEGSNPPVYWTYLDGLYGSAE